MYINRRRFLVLTTALMPASAALSNISKTKGPNMQITAIIGAQRAIGKPVCSSAADRLAASSQAKKRV